MAKGVHLQHPVSKGLIEIRIRDLRQLFNTLDATPFPEQDLDTEAEDFILSWAKEHSPNTPFRIRIHLAEPPSNPHESHLAGQAIRNYFAYRAGILQRQFSQLLKRGRVSLLIGLTCLAGSVVAAQIIGQRSDGTLFGILRESLIIGGWVAMWRPLEIFLYDWWPLRRERRVCERLSDAVVEIVPHR